MKKNRLYTLFIVEDGEVCTFLLKYKLQKSPEFKILHYHTGEEMLGNLHQNPDVVVLDDKLPGMNGAMVLHALKKHFYKIPVIILSAPNSSSAFLEYMGHGIYDYLIKENDSAKLADKLISRIVKTVKQKEARDMDLQKTRILIAIATLILSIIAIFWMMY
ncbi:MAG TPA: response regulator [Bacteroidia bacterium]|jgi:DNA-binding response OmpR family regulator|nr:response regulator [Bacteroidia bacterium]